MLKLRENQVRTFRDPVANLVAANLHATDPLTNGDCDCIFVETAGDLTARCEDGSADITVALPVGWHPIRLSHVRDTTTAVVWVGYR